ncbi:hypothetical protein PoB_007661400 [Plakobranchus ocellatus]|uniref:Uncharacterized protein n=1 Tax=Plakobranchus ocellatus TaxID=259542 RepID=A0AAV4E0T1_9GAST|nr:hypothetical protein PoB_007661400 [Plakobranchus ocellatus]
MYALKLPIDKLYSHPLTASFIRSERSEANITAIRVLGILSCAHQKLQIGWNLDVISPYLSQISTDDQSRRVAVNVYAGTAVNMAVGRRERSAHHQNTRRFF